MINLAIRFCPFPDCVVITGGVDLFSDFYKPSLYSWSCLVTEVFIWIA